MTKLFRMYTFKDTASCTSLYSVGNPGVSSNPMPLSSPCLVCHVHSSIEQCLETALQTLLFTWPLLRSPHLLERAQPLTVQQPKQPVWGEKSSSGRQAVPEIHRTGPNFPFAFKTVP